MACCCCLHFVLLGFAVFFFFLRKYVKGRNYTKQTLIEDKVVIITGANTGIGKANAVDMARRGGKVYIACRSVERGEAALRDIKRESGSENVYFMQLDLGSLASVREFSTKFHEKEKKLDILINNAGIFGNPHGKTKDGFEITVGVNHLGHFLLTHLLLDLLEAAAPSRIINVASDAHKMGPLKKDDFMTKANPNRLEAYGKSKLANVLFSRELAKRLEGTNVTVNSCHPGVVSTEIARDWPTWSFFMNIIFRPLLRSPMQGAQTQICMAIDPALEGVTGKYFNDCIIAQEADFAKDDGVAKWLYEKSAELVGY